jgi:hypothetical protein
MIRDLRPGWWETKTLRPNISGTKAAGDLKLGTSFPRVLSSRFMHLLKNSVVVDEWDASIFFLAGADTKLSELLGA